MSRNRPPPPAAECLCRPYPSSQKGGTLIAENVLDRETHERRLHDADGYRPEECPRCGWPVLHLHDYRERKLRGEPIGDHGPVIRVVRHECQEPRCGAIWRILPRFLARHLWRRWPVVEAATLGPPLAGAPKVPETTVRRWQARLASAARLLVQVLATSGDQVLTEIARTVGLQADRETLVRQYGQATKQVGLAAVAALVHRLAPGVRLM